MKATNWVVIRSKDQDLLGEISREVENAPDVIEIPVLGSIGAGEPVFAVTPDQINALLLALGSAGAFTTLYQILAKLMERHKDHEIMLERGNAKIAIKGHSLADERILIQELFPESSIIQTPKGR